MYTHMLTWNYSSAFDPSSWHLLNTHAHAHGPTLMETDAIHWSGGQPITAPGEHGGMGALLKGT